MIFVWAQQLWWRLCTTSDIVLWYSCQLWWCLCTTSDIVLWYSCQRLWRLCTTSDHVLFSSGEVDTILFTSSHFIPLSRFISFICRTGIPVFFHCLPWQHNNVLNYLKCAILCNFLKLAYKSKVTEIIILTLKIMLAMTHTSKKQLFNALFINCYYVIESAAWQTHTQCILRLSQELVLLSPCTSWHLGELGCATAS